MDSNEGWCPVPEISISFVAIKMGRRQGGVGEASSLCFSERAKRGRFAYHRNPPGRGQLAAFPPGGRRTRSSRIDLDLLFATASPARTALKNSQLTRQPPGERHAYFGGRTLVPPRARTDVGPNVQARMPGSRKIHSKALIDELLQTIFYRFQSLVSVHSFCPDRYLSSFADVRRHNVHDADR
jgi:hypothetical protein